MQYAIYNSKTAADALKKKYPHLNINYVDIINGAEYADALAKKVQKEKPDILYLPIYSYQISAFLMELAKNPFPINIFINNGYLAISEAKYYALILKKSPIVHFHISSTWPELTGPYLQEYIEEVSSKQSIGSEFQDLKSSMTFDAVKMLTSALKKDPTLRGLRLVRNIKSSKFEGATGTIWFDKQGYTMKDKKNIFFIITNQKNSRFFNKNCIKQFQQVAKSNDNGCIIYDE